MEKARILIAEDDAITAKHIKLTLQNLGYEVCTYVSSGEEVIEKAEELRPDLALVDVRMQGKMDGIEAGGEIRAHFSIPVVYLTALSDKSTVEKTKATDPFGYIIKPFDDHQLHATIEMALHKRKLEIERQQAEDLMRESQKELLLTLDATTDGIWKWNFTTNKLFFSTRYYKMLGYEPYEFPATFENWQSLIHPDCLQKALSVAEEYLRTKPDCYENVFRCKTKKGDYRWIQARGTVVERDKEGNAVRMIGNHEDITERKRAEEALRESEEKFKDFFESANVGKSVTLPTGEIETNKAFADLLGYTQEEMKSKTWQELTPADEIESIQRIIDPLLNGEKDSVRFNKRYLHKNGTIIWADVSARIRCDCRGKPLYFITTVIDITERQQAEEKIKNLARFPDENPNPVLRISNEGTILYANKSSAPLLDEWNWKLGQLVTGQWKGWITAAFESGKPKEVEAKWGGRIFSCSINPIADTDYVNIYTRDITEHKQAEKALRDSEEFNRRIIESSNDCIKVLDLEGRLLSMSKGGQKILEIDDLTPYLNRSWIDFWKGNDWEAAREAVSKARKGDVGKFSGFCKTAKGTPKWWEVIITPIKGAHDKVERLLSISRDITERQQAEEEIKTSLKEKEVLLREIHHRVKNNLQTISSLLSLQADYIEDPALQKHFNESRDRVKSMALIHEKIYNTNDLARIEFGPYLRSIVEHLFSSYGRRGVSYSVEVDEIYFVIDTAVPCALLINELVSNALKHAFPDEKNGIIHLEMRAGEKNKITLIVRDDGIGFPQAVDFRNTSSLGLTLVNSLAKQINGAIELNRANGTIFTVTFTHAAIAIPAGSPEGH